MAEAKRFILISTPRAGTHMVRSVLDQHPELCCFGELWHTKRDAWYPECKGMNFKQIDEWIVNQASKPWVGFAIHISAQANTVTKEYWATVQHDSRTPIVYVFRRNQLRQTLSQLRSRQAHKLKGDGGWMSYKPETSGHERFGWKADGLKDIGAITVDCDHFHEITVEREASEIMFFAERRFSRICPVAYEDFVSDRESEIRRITEFLDVEYHVAEPQTERTGSRSYSEMVANVDEFNDYFSRTPYARFLSDD